VYWGTYENGLRDGDSKYFNVSNGCTYDGEWHKDKEHGQGTYTWAGDGKNKGLVHMGQWADGQQEGKGNMLHKSGSVYEGKWHKGMQACIGTAR